MELQRRRSDRDHQGELHRDGGPRANSRAPARRSLRLKLAWTQSSPRRICAQSIRRSPKPNANWRIPAPPIQCGKLRLPGCRSRLRIYQTKPSLWLSGMRSSPSRSRLRRLVAIIVSLPDREERKPSKLGRSLSAMFAARRKRIRRIEEATMNPLSMQQAPIAFSAPPIDRFPWTELDMP